MKFLKYFILAVYIFSTPTLTEANTKLTTIVDSSALNLNLVNKLGAVVDDAEIPLGTVIAWPNPTNRFYTTISHNGSRYFNMPTPNTEECTYTSSNTSLPRCKWILASPQIISYRYQIVKIDATLYPEFVEHFSTNEIFPVGGRGIPYGKTGQERYEVTSSMGYYNTVVHSHMKVEVDIAKTNEGSIPPDGPVQLEVGHYHSIYGVDEETPYVRPLDPNKTGFGTTSTMDFATGTYVPNVILNNTYYMRIAN